MNIAHKGTAIGVVGVGIVLFFVILGITLVNEPQLLQTDSVSIEAPPLPILGACYYNDRKYELPIGMFCENDLTEEECYAKSSDGQDYYLYVDKKCPTKAEEAGCGWAKNVFNNYKEFEKHCNDVSDAEVTEVCGDPSEYKETQEKICHKVDPRCNSSIVEPLQKTKKESIKITFIQKPGFPLPLPVATDTCIVQCKTLGYCTDPAPDAQMP